MHICFIVLMICALVLTAQANTEKVIFKSPKKTVLPVSGPSLAELRLDKLSPSSSVFRTSLSVSFSNATHSNGEQSWYLLSNLRPETRYEVRICWAATQPSKFALEQYTLNEVFETPSLIQDLATYTEDRISGTAEESTTEEEIISASAPQSLLFLRVWAAADFWTLDRELMSNPPEVNVDIILDQFLYNVFPKSLAPTAAYIVVIAILSWFLSGAFWNWLRQYTYDQKSHKD